jgi:hypothetical protein
MKLRLSSVPWPNAPAFKRTVKPSVHAQFLAGTLKVRDGLDFFLFGVAK